MKLFLGFYLVFPADEPPTISLDPDFMGFILVGAEFIPRFFAAMLDVTLDSVVFFWILFSQRDCGSRPAGALLFCYSPHYCPE